MISDQLINEVKNANKLKLPSEVLIHNLIQAGWKIEEIEIAMMLAGYNVTDSIPSQTQTVPSSVSQNIIPESAVIPQSSLLHSDVPKKKNHLRIMLILFSFILAAPFLLVFLFPHILPYILLRSPTEKLDFTQFVQTPVERKIPPAGANNYLNPEYPLKGVSFRTDWKLVNEKYSDSVILYRFENNKVIMQTDEPKLSEIIISRSNSPIVQTDKLLSVSKSSTEYDFYQRLLGTSFKDIKLFANPNKVITDSALLVLKGTLLLNDPGPIYSFTVNEFKGFQIRLPETNVVKLILFDEQDNKYLIDVLGKDITQDEIDSLLITVKKSDLKPSRRLVTVTPMPNATSDKYVACGCGCCAGAVPDKQCLYHAKNDNMFDIISTDVKAKQNPQCSTMGCSRGTEYSYCD